MKNSKRDALSTRKLEGYLKYAKLIQHFRKHPVQFVSHILGIE